MAVTITEGETVTQTGLDADKVSGCIPWPCHWIERYSGASTIPNEVSNEAVIRAVGYFCQAHSPHITGRTVDDFNIRYSRGMTGDFSQVRS